MAKKVATASRKAGQSESKPTAAKKAPEHVPAEAAVVQEPQKQVLAGLRAARTKAWCCGAVIKKHGLDAGITPEIIVEINEMCGSTGQTSGWASAAWHAINGYLNAFPVASKEVAE